ncbi:MAG: cytochrome C [Zetaproteobacteria bacterium CG12_big_fil_rev_8_21_14_0_65_54_13]|nr:MAG: cytochrome C [Zetaproteobacteria bacterium CG12_big_fil_rev_8_21_14_0_65_54_13]PIX53623.1 MAG: cytochrome C [Zetaproteobacteria bacterium CG_4_10_14_3_um_filter_54_28]PJA27919.1 MAG: cytochrome C [Zetaproteobacteria bacterium CG_4_9_14_3_um_filter_54_145]
MKRYVWIFSVMIAGALTACGSADDQRSQSPDAMAAKKIAEIQTVVDQAMGARRAVETADNNKQIAVQQAAVKRAAVRAVIAGMEKETEMLKKNAESKARWAALTRERVEAARASLLQAALEQSLAEEVVVEKAKALQAARIQVEIQQDIAGKAMQEKIDAERLAKHVISAEKLAALSIDMGAPADQDTAAASSGPPTVATKAAMTSKPRTVASRNHSPAPRLARTPPSVTHKPASRVSRSAAEPVQLASLSPAPATNVARGHDLSRKCQLCHTFEANQKGKFGPTLFGVLGQQAGKSEGYKYSKTLAQASFSWDEAALTDWVCNSGRAVKELTGSNTARTTMPSQNSCGQDAKDIVAYLSTLKAEPSRLALAD